MNPKSKNIEVAGKTLTATVFTVKTFRPIMHRVGLIMSLIKATSSNDSNIIGTIAIDSYDGIIDIIKMNTKTENEFIESLELTEAIDVLNLIIEVNKDSFLLIKKRFTDLLENLNPKEHSKDSGKPVSNS